MKVASKNIQKSVLKLYGKQALQRVQILEKELNGVNKKTKFPIRKILLVNKAINKITYKKDKDHWGKAHNATFLEFVGSGAGDSLDFAFAKYLSLINLGFDSTKFKFFKTSTTGISKIKFDTTNYYVLGYASKDNGQYVMMDCYKDKLDIVKGDALKKYKVAPITNHLFYFLRPDRNRL